MTDRGTPGYPPNYGLATGPNPKLGHQTIVPLGLEVGRGLEPGAIFRVTFWPKEGFFYPVGIRCFNGPYEWLLESIRVRGASATPYPGVPVDASGHVIPGVWYDANAIESYMNERKRWATSSTSTTYPPGVPPSPLQPGECLVGGPIDASAFNLGNFPADEGRLCKVRPSDGYWKFDRMGSFSRNDPAILDARMRGTPCDPFPLMLVFYGHLAEGMHPSRSRGPFEYSVESRVDPKREDDEPSWTPSWPDEPSSGEPSSD